MLRNTLKGILILGLVSFIPISQVEAKKHNIRAGLSLPLGTYFEYEHKMLLNRVGLFASASTFSGSFSDGDSSTDLDLTSWTAGVRAHLLLGFYINAGYTSINIDGSVTDSDTSLKVPASVSMAGLNLGIGYKLGLGPVSLGLEGGILLAETEITSKTTNAIGDLIDIFEGVDSIPYISIYAGIAL